MLYYKTYSGGEEWGKQHKLQSIEEGEGKQAELGSVQVLNKQVFPNSGPPP